MKLFKNKSQEWWTGFWIAFTLSFTATFWFFNHIKCRENLWGKHR